MNKACIICNNNNFKIVFNEFGIDILKCKSCGHVFSSFGQKQDYKEYFGKVIDSDNFWWDKAHEKIYNDFCKKFIFSKTGRLLDVGSGLGYFVKKVSENNGWDVYGYEISTSAVKFAKNKLDLKNIFEGKVENSKFPKNHFDIITLWDVVEHIPNPYPMLKYLYTILKKNGILFIHTPNIKIQLPKAKIKKWITGYQENGHYLEAKDHINIYSPKTI